LPSGNLPLVDQVQEVELLPVKAISDLSDLIFEP